MPDKKRNSHWKRSKSVPYPSTLLEFDGKANENGVFQSSRGEITEHNPILTGGWKRPESVPYPSIWHEFEGKIETNGKRRKYWVQDVTEDHMDSLIYWLENGLYKDEPLCKYSDFGPEDIKVAVATWKGFLSKKVSLICLTNDENGKPIIAGYNVLGIATKDDKKTQCTSKKVSAVIDVMSYLCAQRNAFTELNIDEYLSGLGLFILPSFRGEALGLELLKARIPLCKAMNLKATLTVFSSFISQKLAARCGFTDFYSMDYDDIAKINPDWKLEGIKEHTEICKNMCMIVNK